MAAMTIEAMQRDDRVMSVARALSAANEVAGQHGTDVASSLVTISEESSPTGWLWRIHYGPKDFLGRRGGDLSVLVDEHTAEVRQVVRGQ